MPYQNVGSRSLVSRDVILDNNLLGAIQVLRDAMGGGGIWIGADQRYKSE